MHVKPTRLISQELDNVAHIAPPLGAYLNFPELGGGVETTLSFWIVLQSPWPLEYAHRHRAPSSLSQQMAPEMSGRTWQRYRGRDHKANIPKTSSHLAPVLFSCRASVADAGPAWKQHRSNDSSYAGKPQWNMGANITL